MGRVNFVVFKKVGIAYLFHLIWRTSKSIRLLVDNMIITQLQLFALPEIDWRAVSQSACWQSWMPIIISVTYIQVLQFVKKDKDIIYPYRCNLPLINSISSALTCKFSQMVYKKCTDTNKVTWYVDTRSYWPGKVNTSPDSPNKYCRKCIETKKN